MKSPLFAFAALASVALADERGDTPDTKPSTPEEQLAKFHVPPGFEVQLVAAEPQIQKPINLNFDAAGRLWVTGSEMYPWPASTDVNGRPIPNFDQGWQGMVDSFKVGEAPQPSPVARDTVRILSRFDTNGRARHITVFADKLNIPSGIQPLPRKPGGWLEPRMGTDAGGNSATSSPSSSDPSVLSVVNPSGKSVVRGDSAIVYSIPNIWLMTDVDGDGFAEKREPLYTGFGYTDTHGGSSSYIHWIDGWIYGTHGFKNHSEVRDRNGKVTVVDSGNTYRFRPDGTAFEIYAHGQTNPFGLAFDPLGNLFSADSHSKPVYLLLRGGYYEGIGKNHDGLGFAPRITDDDHGSSSIAGIAYYADDQWPEEYRGNLFNGNPVTRRINRDRLEWHGSTPEAIRMPDFLTCDDPWFRPVNLKLGPDGALYIADFYNPIIGHYEVPLTHPARDHRHGRIWRVVWRGLPGGALDPSAVSGGPPETLKGTAIPGEVVLEATPNSVPGGSPATALRSSAPLNVPIAPDLTKLEAPALIERLTDPSLEVRRLAINELVERLGPAAVKPILTHIKECRPLQDPLFSNETPAALPEVRQSIALFACGERLSEAMLYSPGASELREALVADFSSIVDLKRHALRAKSEWAKSRFPLFEISTLVWGLSDESAQIQFAASQGISLIAQGLMLPEKRRAVIESRPPPSSIPGLENIPESSDSKLGEFHFDMALEGVASCIKPLLICWDYTPPEDVQLIYATRMALRDCLTVPNVYTRAQQIAAINPQAANHLADISLAVKTPEAATFLLAHLERTKLETPRASEYLKYAALHLPVEKFEEVVKLVETASESQLARRLAFADALGQAARQRKLELPEQIAAWSQVAILEALASGDENLSRQGVDAVRDLKIDEKLDPLAKIIGDEARDETLRIAALEAVSNLPASRALLATTLADPRHYKLRKRASELLVAGGFTEILAALPTAPFNLAQSMAGDLIDNGDDGCRQLLDLIEAGQVSPRLLRNRLIEILLGRRDKALQARAAALTHDLPPEDERLDKLIAQRAKDFAKAQPDAAHGAQVFQQNCAVCHRFRNEGGNVGPNLDGMSARGAQRVIEDILDPNRNLDPAFRQVIFETLDGQTLAGSNLREQGDAWLLTDATGKELNVPKAAIKTRTTSPLSLMPPAFETLLAPADFNDLLTYLLGDRSSLPTSR